MLRLSLVLSLLALPLLACSTDPDPTDPDPTNPDPTDPDPDLERCKGFSFPLDPPVTVTHTSTCNSTACGNGLNPPTAGPHCAFPLACQVFDAEQPPCNWLHNLEHGHAVFLYNCPEGCPEEVAKLEAARNEAFIGTNSVRRALVAPAPGLPHRIAAILWRRAYLADTADPEALHCLLRFQDQGVPEPRVPCAP